MARIRRWVFAGVLLLVLWLLGARPPEAVLLRPMAGTPSPALPALTPSAVPTASPPTPGSRYGLAIVDFRLHPDGPLYAGDRLSFEVEVRNVGRASLAGGRVEIRRGGPEGEEILAEAALPELAPGASHRVAWTWVWQAPGSGTFPLIGIARGEGAGGATEARWAQLVTLGPQEALPETERRARWAQARSRCCTHVYLTGTAAEADLARLMAWADEAEATVRARMGLSTPLPIYVVWIPRLLGHGGFAVGDSLILTYPVADRLPVDLPTILRHEMVHRMTCAWIGREDCVGHLPALITEGLAVFIAGGHYRPEPLTQRAAALLRMGGWIPLEELVEDFYAHPHEIGYLEAGAFVEELVRKGGWPRFLDFLRSLERRPGESDRTVLDRALRDVYHQDIRGIESRWREALERLSPDPEQAADLRFVWTFFEALRAYQRTYDPSAYFLKAWLPDWRQAVREGIVADFMRAPDSPEGRRAWQDLQAARAQAARGDIAAALAALQALCRALGCSDVAEPVPERPGLPVPDGRAKG
jgi:hypothetical protein